MIDKNVELIIIILKKKKLYILQFEINTNYEVLCRLKLKKWNKSYLIFCEYKKRIN